MTPRHAALDALEATARNTALAERDLRENFAQEVRRLETERSRAYRRFNFLSALIAADAGAPDREASRAAQRAAAADELGWDEMDEQRTEILASLKSLSNMVHDERLLADAEEQTADRAPGVTRVSDEGAPDPERSSALLLALAAFEAQFEETRGKPFAELFDRHRPETPLVDF